MRKITWKCALTGAGRDNSGGDPRSIIIYTIAISFFPMSEKWQTVKSDRKGRKDASQHEKNKNSSRCECMCQHAMCYVLVNFQCRCVAWCCCSITPRKKERSGEILVF